MKGRSATFRTIGVVLLAAIGNPIRAGEPLPKQGDFIAMGGDSITWMSRYSVYVETYLLSTRPDLDLRVMKIQRWCGGTADNYANETLEQELIPAKPNIFTICFGMNDGGGREFDADTAHRYESALTRIVERNRTNGTTTIVCSPGAVDPFSYHNPEWTERLLKHPGGPVTNPAANGEQIVAGYYNQTLASLSDVGRRVAETHRMPFAAVHDAMMQVLEGAVPEYGKSWPPRTSLRWPDRHAILCDDGIHPDTAGHIPMAYAVLKAMGFDGNIGAIDLDWEKQSVQTDAGQTATMKSRGQIQIESRRLPMCFFDDSACGEGYPSVPDRYVLRYCPFNQDLNRYRLRISGLPNQPIRVKWGDRSQIFTREQLEGGINLAAEFPENPFCPTERALDAAIFHKQVFDRNLFIILNMTVWNKHFEGATPEDRRNLLEKSLDEFSKWSAKEFADNPRLLDQCEKIKFKALRDVASVTDAELTDVRRPMFEKDRALHDAARALVKPVKHVIAVTLVP